MTRVVMFRAAVTVTNADGQSRSIDRVSVRELLVADHLDLPTDLSDARREIWWAARLTGLDEAEITTLPWLDYAALQEGLKEVLNPLKSAPVS